VYAGHRLGLLETETTVSVSRSTAVVAVALWTVLTPLLTRAAIVFAVPTG
jgi:hypothetical protein